jgi:hypothetical protein
LSGTTAAATDVVGMRVGRIGWSVWVVCVGICVELYWLVLMPILLRMLSRRSSNAVVATIGVIHVYDMGVCVYDDVMMMM